VNQGTYKKRHREQLPTLFTGQQRWQMKRKDAKKEKEQPTSQSCSTARGAQGRICETKAKQNQGRGRDVQTTPNHVPIQKVVGTKPYSNLVTMTTS